MPSGVRPDPRGTAGCGGAGLTAGRGEPWFAAALADVAGPATGDGDVQRLLWRLVGRAAELLDADVALFLTDRDDSLRVEFCTTEAVAAAGAAELRAGPGALAAALRTGEPVLNLEPVGGAGGWRARLAAVAPGYTTVSAFPLRHGETIGVLGAFGRGGHPVTPAEAELAGALVHVAAAAVVRAWAEWWEGNRADRLEQALRSRVVVEQAKGMLAEQLGLEVTEALTLLRHAARRRGERLADVAGGVVAGVISGAELVADVARRPPPPADPRLPS